MEFAITAKCNRYLVSGAAILPSHEGFEFVRELAQDFQEIPLVEPTDSLLEKMLANSIDSLLLQVAYLPGV